jgi:chemotaxis regulatin CheY-phosphate phosphatase CheZ
MKDNASPRNIRLEEGVFAHVDHIIQLTEELSKQIESINSVLAGETGGTKLLEPLKKQSKHILNELRVLPSSLNKTRDLVEDILRSVSASREELCKSVGGLLQKTGSQLEKVTAATEDATNKILDVTEKLSGDLMDLNESIEDVRSDLVDNTQEASKKLEKISNTLQENQGDIFQIMDFLQFQDITTQQINHAYSLLDATQDKLVSVTFLLEGVSGNGDQKKPLEDRDRNTFDPEADFDHDKSKNNQDEIDALFGNSE